MDAAWMWALIPIAAIFARMIRDILHVRNRQQVLGQSNRELEQVVSDLRTANQQLADRVENLETIVVSQTWNTIHEPDLSDTERQRKLASVAQHEVRPPAAEEVNRQRAEQLARRLQG